MSLNTQFTASSMNILIGWLHNTSLKLMNKFRCYEAKIEESEKAGSCQESNPGHLWLELPVLCH